MGGSGRGAGAVEWVREGVDGRVTSGWEQEVRADERVREGAGAGGGAQ